MTLDFTISECQGRVISDETAHEPARAALCGHGPREGRVGPWCSMANELKGTGTTHPPFSRSELAVVSFVVEPCATKETVAPHRLIMQLCAQVPCVHNVKAALNNIVRQYFDFLFLRAWARHKPSSQCQIPPSCFLRPSFRLWLQQAARVRLRGRMSAKPSQVPQA